MSSVAQRLITAEEFARMPGSKHQELVRGEVKETMPPGGRHGAIAVAGTLLRIWAKQVVGGYVGVEAGFILAHNPDVVRGPDVSYVSADRIPPDGIPEAFWTIAPDLAVEVISPSETADEVREKVRDFLAAGTPIGVDGASGTGEVVVHTGDGLARTYGEDDLIEYPDVLPGFSCKVSRFILITRSKHMELGFIGLGRMGANMVHRLVLGGHRVVAYNRSPDKTREVAALAPSQPSLSRSLSTT